MGTEWFLIGLGFGVFLTLVCALLYLRRDRALNQNAYSALAMSDAASRERLISLEKLNEGAVKEAETAKSEVLKLNRICSGLEVKVGHLEEIRQNLNLEKDKFQKYAEERLEQVSSLNSKLATSNSERQFLQEQVENQKANLAQGLNQMKSEFEALANKVFEVKGKSFSEQTEKNVGAMLKPLDEKIKEFREKIDIESKDRFALKYEIGRLVEVNEKMTKETNSLSETLRGDSKAQGDWGEHILQNILEAAGLSEGRDFQKQSTLETQDGNDVRPDILVNLPNGKHLIIDSKVSLTAFDRYKHSEDPEVRLEALKDHLNSIQKHIDDLSGKHYSKAKGIDSPDWVFMFVAVEPAYVLAMQNDSNLFYRAQKKNVMIITASTLLASLKTVSYIWQLENQRRNANKIAEEAGNLYDKFVLFFEEFEKVGKTLDVSKKQYESAMTRLKNGNGNVFRRFEVIRELGAAPSKKIRSELIESSGAPEISEFVIVPSTEIESKLSE